RRVGLGGDCEPDVELVVAQVVVRHARVRVDHVGRPPGIVGIDLGGDQHRRVAQRAGVEDRRDLADDALVEQTLNAVHYLLLGDPGGARDVLIGLAGDREAALHQVEQALVQVVELDRRAVLAAAELGAVLAPGRGVPRGLGRAVRRAYCSHPAASLAWYVITMSAPARRIEVSDSRTAERSSRYPAATAALSIEYSPLTL